MASHQQLPVDPSLMHSLQVSEESGEATRPWMWVGLFLTYCQACPNFRGADCPQFPGARFRLMLIDVHSRCSNWVRIHENERLGVRGEIVAVPELERYPHGN